MGTIFTPEPVNLIIGMLSSVAGLFATTETELERCYGEIDFTSDILPFTFTDYYTQEMGNNIFRKFLSFKPLINPEQIAQIKVDTNELESALTDKDNPEITRSINIDPGYVCNSRLILASTKDFTHRIYLQKGIFAETTLTYSSKERSFVCHQLTFPDYRTDEYINFFNNVRSLYRNKLSMQS